MGHVLERKTGDAHIYRQKQLVGTLMSSNSAVSEFVYIKAANLYLVTKPASDSKNQAAEKLKS